MSLSCPNEYQAADKGAGLGASLQAGWTGLASRMIQLFGVLDHQAPGCLRDRHMGLAQKNPHSFLDVGWQALFVKDAGRALTAAEVSNFLNPAQGSWRQKSVTLPVYSQAGDRLKNHSGFERTFICVLGGNRSTTLLGAARLARLVLYSSAWCF